MKSTATTEDIRRATDALLDGEFMDLPRETRIEQAITEILGVEYTPELAARIDAEWQRLY